VKSTDAYKIQGHQMFDDLKKYIQQDVAHAIFHVRIEQREAKQPESPMARVADGAQSSVKKKAAVAGKKVGRNDPCPCGSGKKYKHCCGR